MREEERLRDYLAEHLDIIETGLRLIRREYPVPNSFGAKGSIDILAKDGLGHLVVVEIKRSDKTAREAIHELFKYTSLLLQNEGLGPSRVRAILVSTTWHELRVPFSAFARSAPFSTHGLQLLLDAHGIPQSTHRVQTEALETERRFSEHQMWYLFDTAARRTNAIPSLHVAIASIPIEDYVVVSLDYVGDHSGVFSRFALYLAMDQFTTAQRARLEPTVSEETAQDFDRENDEWWLESIALSRVSAHWRGSDRPNQSEYSYPQKFAAETQSNWSISSIERAGRLSRSRLTVSDDDITAALRGFEGGNPEIFMVAATPDIAPSWTEMKESLAKFLEGIEAWRIGMAMILRRLECEQADARVAVRAYNQNPLMAFIQLSLKHTTDYLPDAELFGYSKAQDTTTQAIGFLHWDGTQPPSSAADAFRDIVEAGGPWGFMFGAGSPQFMLPHGLHYALATRTRKANEPWQHATLENVNGEWVFVDRPAVDPNRTLGMLFEKHGDYMAELISCFREVYKEI